MLTNDRSSFHFVVSVVVRVIWVLGLLAAMPSPDKIWITLMSSAARMVWIELQTHDRFESSAFSHVTAGGANWRRADRD
jgi:hypothetical protein